MGEDRKAWIFPALLGLAFVGGLGLALTRRDVAWFIEPAIGVSMILMGAWLASFFLFGRVFEGPVPSDVERAFRRRQAGMGAGFVLFGVSQLLPTGSWGSWTALCLAALAMVATLLAARRALAVASSRPG